MKRRGLVVVITVIISIASFVVGGTYYQNKMENKITSRYMNAIYFKLEDLINLLSVAEMWEETLTESDIGYNYYYRFIINLNELQQLFKGLQGHWSQVDSLQLVENIIASGVTYNNEHICNAFNEDGVLSSDELDFLYMLMKDLEEVKAGMYSEETGQEDPNLTISKLSHICDGFRSKYSHMNITSLIDGN